MSQEEITKMWQAFSQMYNPQGGNIFENPLMNTATLQRSDSPVLPTNNTTNLPPLTVTPTSNIPQEVLNEPVQDWQNEGLVFQGQRYKVDNGQWVADSEPKTGVAPWAGEEEDSNTNTFDWNNYAPFLNPYGTNLQTDFYNLGRFSGMEKGTPGRGLGIAGAGVSALLGGARTALSGYANSVATARTQQEARDKMARRKYTPQTQYRNNDYLGNL